MARIQGSWWRNIALMATFIFPLVGANSAVAEPTHGIAMHGEPKYSAGFSHFDYVNPKAPVGGSFKQASRGTFDSFNPFIVKGTPADGVGLIYDTLMIGSADEPFSRYGLVAQQIEVAADFSEVTFYLNPAARFHDGQAITAKDIAFSYEILTTQGAPHYRSYYAGVEKTEIMDERTIKFIFKPGENRELPLIIGEMPVLPAHYWQDKQFDRSSLAIPVGSGPYKIASFDAGRKVVYQRDEKYWAKDLNVRVGHNNFSRMQYEYFRDTTVAFQAFKAGVYDYHQEYSAKSWATAYHGSVFDQNKILREKVADANPQGMQGFFFNLRRDKFQDPRVRQAIATMFDFEWLNRQLFYSQYTRSNSFFANSELAANALPSEQELAILAPYRSQLPASVFEQEYQPSHTQGDGNIRPQMRQAVALFEAAGYQLKNSKMLDKDGKPLFFEFLVYDKSFERVIQPYRKNLSRIGIETVISLVDISQYINRLNSFDFDLVTMRLGQSNSPGNEQHMFWSCDSAKSPGSRNYAGICDPTIDALIEQVISAQSREQLVVQTKALDRVLQHGHFVVPQWYSPSHRIAYWDKFERPDIRPAYSIGTNTWWAKPKQEHP
ncbi:extracellular solute-binding protein [Motilimonas pumila]|nr:extracellular solute-binding protein [Motilimonas pumila]